MWIGLRYGLADSGGAAKTCSPSAGRSIGRRASKERPIRGVPNAVLINRPPIME